MMYEVTGFTQIGHSISVATNCMGSLPLHWATLSEVVKRTSLPRIMHAGFGFPRSYRAFAEHVRGTCAARPPLRLGKYTIWFITMPARGWAFLCTYRQ